MCLACKNDCRIIITGWPGFQSLYNQLFTVIIKIHHLFLSVESGIIFYCIGFEQ